MVDQSHHAGGDGAGIGDATAVLRPQIRRVDPLGAANAASAILNLAWRPPSLHYSPEYLRFHCGFPTALAPVSLAAYQGDEMVGFVAATGRRSSVGEVYLSSFLSLRPGSTPSLPIAMVRQETRLLREAGRPSLIFAQVGSIGEYLLKCIDSLRIERLPLGEYRVHTAMPRGDVIGVHVEEAAPSAWAAEAERLRDPALLSPRFDDETVRHFVGDPAGRRFLWARDEAGAIVAVAMQGVTATATATGVDRIPTLHYVRLAEQRPDALKALLGFAKGDAHPIVIVPNAAGISQPVARAAGVRAAGSAFAAYLCPFGAELPPLRGAEFEIV